MVQREQRNNQWNAFWEWHAQDDTIFIFVTVSNVWLHKSLRTNLCCQPQATPTNLAWHNPSQTTDKHSFTFSSQTMRTNLVLQSYHKLSSQTWLYALITSYTKKLSITQTIFISWHSLSKRSTTAFRLPLSHLEWVGISLTMAVKTQRLCPGTKAKSLKNAS